MIPMKEEKNAALSSPTAPKIYWLSAALTGAPAGLRSPALSITSQLSIQSARNCSSAADKARTLRLGISEIPFLRSCCWLRWIIRASISATKTLTPTISWSSTTTRTTYFSWGGSSTRKNTTICRGGSWVCTTKLILVRTRQSQPWMCTDTIHGVVRWDTWREDHWMVSRFSSVTTRMDLLCLRRSFQNWNPTPFTSLRMFLTHGPWTMIQASSTTETPLSRPAVPPKNHGASHRSLGGSLPTPTRYANLFKFILLWCSLHLLILFTQNLFIYIYIYMSFIRYIPMVTMSSGLLQAQY